MIYYFNIIVTLLVSIPASVVGYLYEALTDGFRVGRFVCKNQMDATAKRFLKKESA